MSSFGGNGSGSAAVAPPPQNVRPPAGRIVRAPGPRSSRRTSKSRSPAGSIGNRDQVTWKLIYQNLYSCCPISQRRASPARSASQPRPVRSQNLFGAFTWRAMKVLDFFQKDDKASNANQNRKVRPAGAKQAKAKARPGNICCLGFQSNLSAKKLILNFLAWSRPPTGTEE